VSDRLLVLGWHNATGTYGFPSAEGAAQRGLAQQMKTLARIANVLPLEQALAQLKAGEKLPGRAVALTFDDGYRDNLEVAAPLLERLGLPATFFLVPRLLSGEADAWWETIGWALQSSSRTSLRWEDVSVSLNGHQARDAAYSEVVKRLKLRDQAARDRAMGELLELLDPPGEHPNLFMDWDGARELVKRGFSVQSHTSSHVILSREGPERQRHELTDARHELERELGVRISTIAYPHGGTQDYTSETVAIAAEAGYSWGVTTREAFTTSATSPLEIRRCVVYPERGVVDLLAQLRYLLGAWVKGRQP
jgi:peptidoglycan/xylan/chitin deacetylase (PgdA/CDA1 family)